MVEYGVVSQFLPSGYGFIRIVDEDGKRTGKEVFFHINQFSDVVIGSRLRIMFHDTRSSIPVPHKDDEVVLTCNTNSQGMTRATHWAFRKDWDVVVTKRSTERNIAWRIVLKGHTEYDPERHDTVMAGITYGAPKAASKWTADMLGFYESAKLDDLHRGYSSCTSYLQIKQDGHWTTVKPLAPLPEPNSEEPDNTYSGYDGTYE